MRGKMRVGIVGPGINQGGSSGNQAFYYPSHGMECKLVSSTRTYRNLHPLIKKNGFEAYNFKCGKGIPLSFIDYNILSSVIKWSDIVHVYHTAFPINDAAAIIAKFIYNKPLVVTTADGIVYKGLRFRMNSYIPWTLADRIISFSDWEKGWLSSIGISRSKIITIPLAVNFDRIMTVVERQNEEKISSQNREYVEFIYSARKHPFKNMLMLVECIGEAARQTKVKIRCTMPGRIADEQYFLKVRKLISKLNLEENFNLLPEVTFDELIGYYLKSDVLINPAILGTFDVIVLEAMACGLPVIVSKAVGASEIVEKEGCGFVVDAHDNTAIVNSILRLANDDKLRAEFGQIASNAVNTKYNYHAMIKEIKKVYLDLTLTGK